MTGGSSTRQAASAATHIAEGIGVLRAYGQAPADAQTAVIRWRDGLHKVPIRNGHWAFAVWNATESDTYRDHPKAIEFR